MTRWRKSRHCSAAGDCPQEASRLQTVLLDVTELTERADNAIKFFSDMFSARLYRLAAHKIGVHDYKSLAKEKLRTAEDLYRFLIDQFHQSRTFVLESMVVLILLIELVYVFHGKMSAAWDSSAESSSWWCRLRARQPWLRLPRAPSTCS